LNLDQKDLNLYKKKKFKVNPANPEDNPTRPDAE
jgi:hypothetical protein